MQGRPAFVFIMLLGEKVVADPRVHCDDPNQETKRRGLRLTPVWGDQGQEELYGEVSGNECAVPLYSHAYLLGSNHP